LIHASGVLKDKFIQNKTLEDFDAVYGTKVYGLRALLKVLPLNQLKHLIVFSSLAGFHGNRGQADYALANEVLNKAVHVIAARFPDCDARAFDFGPWGGGMVTPQLQKMFEEQGVEIIPRAGGAETVANVLFYTNQSQALYGNWGLAPTKPLEPTIQVARDFLVGSNDNKFLDSHLLKKRRVLPFTLSTIAMGQMAADTHPGYYLHSIQDAQLFRGFVVSENQQSIPMMFIMTDKKEENGKLEVEVKLNTTAQGKEVPALRCVAVLGQRPRTSFSVNPLTEADVSKVIKSQAELYNMSVLFHGPDFRTISGITYMADSKLVAECKKVKVSDEGQFQSSGAVDGFLADTAFQLQLIHARLMRKSGALPCFAKSFDFYRAVPTGVKLYAVLLHDEVKADLLKSQFYFCDEDGKVYMGGVVSVTLSPNLSWD